jgi:hypothetical protein
MSFIPMIIPISSSPPQPCKKCACDSCKCDCHEIPALKKALASMLIVLIAIYLLISFLDGCGDAKYNVLKGNSLIATVMQHSPTYWLGYKLSEPHYKY